MSQQAHLDVDPTNTTVLLVQDRAWSRVPAPPAPREGGDPWNAWYEEAEEEIAHHDPFLAEVFVGVHPDSPYPYLCLLTVGDATNPVYCADLPDLLWLLQQLPLRRLDG